MDGSDLDQLAASFVTQYYEGLLLQPKSLAACYGPDSTMCVSYASGASDEAQGPQQVESRMLNLSAELPETKKLQVLHAEIFPSFDNSSLIIIEGVVLSPESHQDFSHTVVLRNNGVEGEFYIRNDVWRFADAVSTVAKQAPVVEQVAIVEEIVEAEEEVVEEAEEVVEAEAEVEAEEEEVAQSEKDEESVAESTPSKQQSATPSEVAVESPAKPEAKPQQPKGPINWASKVRAAPAVAPTAAPKRVSPPPAEKKTEKPTVAKKTTEEKPKKVAEEKEGEQRGTKRQQAKSLLVVKVRDVKDEEVIASLPEALSGGLVSLRNTSSENSRVFLDFTQANALEIMKNPELRIGGKVFTVEAQKKR